MTTPSVPEEQSPRLPGVLQRTGAVLLPDLPRRLWTATFVLAAVLIGVAAGIEPILALGVVTGLVLGAVAVANLTIGLCLFSIVVFVDNLPGVAGERLFAKPVAILLVAGTLVALAVRHPAERRTRDFAGRHPVLVWALVLLLVWSLVSLLWSEDTAGARATVFGLALNLALFPIAFAALRKPRHAEVLATLFIGGTLLAAGWRFVSGTVADAASDSAGLDENQLGALLMVAVVLATALGCNRTWPSAARVAALSAAFVGSLGLLATGSRGAVFGMAVALLVSPFVAGRGRQLHALAIVALSVLTAAVWLATLAPYSDAVQRLTRLDRSGYAGGDRWTVGVRIVEDKPLHGVGAGNLETASVHYLVEPGTLIRDDFVVDAPSAPHDIYLHVAAELGLVGLALFLAVVACCLLAALRAARAFARNGDAATELLARGLFVALVGLLAAGCFSSELQTEQLWLLLATAPALLGVARRSAPARPATPVYRSP